VAKTPKFPVTPAIRALRDSGAIYEPQLYDYVERGGTRASSAALGVEERCVIKTLILIREDRSPLCVLMHGDREIATGVLAKTIGAKKISAADPKVAEKHSGYRIGGTSPFGLRTKMPIFVEETVLTLPKLYINGGKRGFLVSMSGEELRRVCEPTVVHVAQPESR
jgi:Cys-tRNA(Pro) deacylase